MRATAGAVLLALCLRALCHAEDLPQAITTREGFTISLPADWVATPKHTLDRSSEALVKQAPKVERQVFDYGFQLPPSERINWSTLLRTTGRRRVFNV